MFHTGAASSYELALTTIAAARSRPSLAAAIRRSTRRPESPAWIVEFLRYPRWEQLCEDSTIDTDGEVADDCLNAHAEALRASLFEFESHDCVFWDWLTRDSSAQRRATEETDSLSPDHNDVLRSELSGWIGAPEPAPLPADWRLRAQCEALRQTAQRRALEVEILSAETMSSLIAAAAQSAEQELGSELAVWVGEANGNRGHGAVSFFDPVECTQLEFERRFVPWFFRHSREMKTANRAAIVLYSSVAVDRIDKWSSMLSRARVLELLRPLVVEQLSIEAEVDSRYWSAVAEFGAGAGHTINNPLGAIAGLAERLLDGETAPDRRSSLHKIRTQVDRIHRMIRDLHLLGRPGKQTEGVGSITDSVNQGVAKALARFADRPTPRCVVEEASRNIFVPVALAESSRVVEELVANALDAAGPQGFVEVQTVATSKGVEIRVVDNGPGFSTAELANAFSPFFAGRSAGRGLGMGLPVCRRIVERAGGRIAVRRTRPTTVVVELPTINGASIRQAA
jgi:signal transduction histidine kinase